MAGKGPPSPFAAAAAPRGANVTGRAAHPQGGPAEGEGGPPGLFRGLAWHPELRPRVPAAYLQLATPHTYFQIPPSWDPASHTAASPLSLSHTPLVPPQNSPGVGRRPGRPRSNALRGHKAWGWALRPLTPTGLAQGGGGEEREGGQVRFPLLLSRGHWHFRVAPLPVTQAPCHSGQSQRLPPAGGGC